MGAGMSMEMGEAISGMATAAVGQAANWATTIECHKHSCTPPARIAINHAMAVGGENGWNVTLPSETGDSFHPILSRAIHGHGWQLMPAQKGVIIAMFILLAFVIVSAIIWGVKRRKARMAISDTEKGDLLDKERMPKKTKGSPNKTKATDAGDGFPNVLVAATDCGTSGGDSGHHSHYAHPQDSSAVTDSATGGGDCGFSGGDIGGGGDYGNC
ncbi:MAG: hypothetical protein Q9179_000457 [Wetmoreana sp. 5 TL-2023]